MRKEIFENSKAVKQIIGLRLYDEDDEFWLGYVEDFNDRIIQLRYFDKLGLEDGLVIMQQENIDNIDFESDYTKTYSYLINKRNDLNKIRKVVDFKQSDNWRIEYLTAFKTKNKIISIEFNNDFVIYGYVLEMTDIELIIKAIGNLGEDEGKTIYRTTDITAFRIADKESKLREELNSWRKVK